MAKKKTPKNPDFQSEISPTVNPAMPPAVEKKSYLSTSMTGLQDCAYWWRYARERAKTSKPNTKTFRRGRIWA